MLKKARLVFPEIFFKNIEVWQPLFNNTQHDQFLHFHHEVLVVVHPVYSAGKHSYQKVNKHNNNRENVDNMHNVQRELVLATDVSEIQHVNHSQKGRIQQPSTDKVKFFQASELIVICNSENYLRAPKCVEGEEKEECNQRFQQALHDNREVPNFVEKWKENEKGPKKCNADERVREIVKQNSWVKRRTNPQKTQCEVHKYGDVKQHLSCLVELDVNHSLLFSFGCFVHPSYSWILHQVAPFHNIEHQLNWTMNKTVKHTKPTQCFMRLKRRAKTSRCGSIFKISWIHWGPNTTFFFHFKKVVLSNLKYYTEAASEQKPYEHKSSQCFVFGIQPLLSDRTVK